MRSGGEMGADLASSLQRIGWFLLALLATLTIFVVLFGWLEKHHKLRWANSNTLQLES